MEFNHFFSSYLPDRASGIVEHGAIVPLPREQTIEELAENLIIYPPAEMLHRLAEEVMPHFTRRSQPQLPQASGVA